MQEIGFRGPECFPLEFHRPTTYEMWKSGARTSIMDRACKGHEYCQDCTNAYQTEMKLQERCKHPQVTFLIDNDGMLTGHDPDDLYVYRHALAINPEKRAREKGTINQESHCVTCGHKLNICWWKNRHGEKTYLYARCRYCKTNERVK